MQISSSNTSGASESSAMGALVFSTARKAFANVGKSLDSGDLKSAQSALAEFLKNVPSGGDTNYPVAQKVATLGKAIESGNLDAAKTAYSEAQQTMAQQRAVRQGGNQPAQVGQQEKQPQVGPVANKEYDVRDTNKDGKISLQEQVLYALKHPTESSSVAAATTAANDKTSTQNGTLLDVLA